jgi:hypothetical protein
VVAGNQVAVLDPTSLAQTDRTLMTFTGGISALLQSRFDGIAPIGSGAAGVTAFRTHRVGHCRSGKRRGRQHPDRRACLWGG